MKADDLAISGEMMEAWMKDYALQRKRMTKRTPKRRRRKSGFKVRWIAFPVRWHERLRAAKASSAAYSLALTILTENYKLEQMAVKEIILSNGTTGLSKGARQRAVSILVRLKLIRIKRGTGKAVRVSDLYYL
jgi:hypothetical protein